jgi:hypothetical protein
MIWLVAAIVVVCFVITEIVLIIHCEKKGYSDESVAGLVFVNLIIAVGATFLIGLH